MHPDFSTLAKALSWVVMTGLCGWVGGFAQTKAATPPAADARQGIYADLIQRVRVGACGVPRTEDKRQKTEADRLYLQGGYFRDVDAVALGHSGSMRRLGLLLWEGCEYEEKNPAKAVALLRKAGRLGDAEAQLWLWYQIGNGAVAPEEPAEDRKWIRKFAEQTKPAIKLPLAAAFLTGDAGLPKDREAAVQLFHAAVRERHGERGSDIARRFLGGIEGFPKDVALAIEFYQEAGAFGDVNALKTLGAMYATGQNVRKDPVEAWLLFNTAKVQNDRQAAEALRKLEATMSSAERAQVQKRLGVKSKEQFQLAEDACRTVQELESMGFFEAEIEDNRNRTRLSVLEASFQQIMGDDPTKPLVVTRELGQNYVMAREVWKAIAQTNRAFAEAWALVDANGGLEGSGDIRLRYRGELPFWMATTVGGSGAEAPVLYRIRTLKQQLDRGGPGACLSPADELDLRDLKKQAEAHLAEYRGLAKAYTTVIAGLEAAGARGRRVDMLKMFDKMIAEAELQAATNKPAGSATAHARAETEPAFQRLNQITPDQATVPLVFQGIAATHPEDCEEQLRRADILEQQGNATESLPNPVDQATRLQEAFLIRDACLGPIAPRTLSVLIQLALVYGNIDLEKALSLWSDFLARIEQLPSTESADLNVPKMLAFIQMANGYFNRGDYARADQFYRKAAALPIDGDSDVEVWVSLKAQMLILAGRLHHALGEYSDAIASYASARSLLRSVGGNTRHLRFVAAANLGTTAREIGEFRIALEAEEEALRLVDTPFPNPLARARVLDHLSDTYRRIGNYSLARSNALAAMQIRKEILSTNHPEIAASYSNLGLLDSIEGNPVQGLENLTRALRILASQRNYFHPTDRLTIRENTVLVLLDLGRAPEARAEINECAREFQELFANVLAFAPIEQRLAFQRRTYERAISLAATMADRQPALLSQIILRIKGAVLDSIIEDRRLAEAAVTPEMQAELAKYHEARRRWVPARLAADARVDGEDPRRIQEEIRRLELSLVQAVHPPDGTRNGSPLTMEQLQRALPPGTVLVEFIYYSHYLGRHRWQGRVGALVTAGNTPSRWVPLGKSEEINTWGNTSVALFRSQIVPTADPTAVQEWRVAQQRLFENVWLPVQRSFPRDTKEVIISPDLALGQVSFAALWTGGDDFVGEQFSIRYVSSGRDLLKGQKHEPMKGVLVTFADPDFDASPVLTSGRTLSGLGSSVPWALDPNRGRSVERSPIHFGRLTNTISEALTISNIVAKVPGIEFDLRRGVDATEGALRGVHRPLALHFSTHGHWFGLQRKNTNVPSWEVIRIASDEAMIRSCIALAGANRTADAWRIGQVPEPWNDGFLMADEAGTLDLRGTWLVSLAACNSGVGMPSFGEGIFGLRRAFVQAGAQNLLMTLWPVNDQITTRFMAQFYAEAIKSPRDLAAALHRTQRRFLRELRNSDGIVNAIHLAGPFVISTAGQ
ncbi:MAG: CHAT domain-containing protein [Verrucomicrobiia bacterium]